MKRILLLILTVIWLQSCNTKTITITNNLTKGNSNDKHLAIVDINIKYYTKGDCKGSIHIDSLACEQMSDRMDIPNNAEYVKINFEMRPQTEVDIYNPDYAKFILGKTYVFERIEYSLDDLYYLTGNNTEIIITRNSDYSGEYKD